MKGYGQGKPPTTSQELDEMHQRAARAGDTLAEHRQLVKAYQHRAAFVLNISSYLATLHPHQVDEGINHVLQRIGKLINVERCHVFQLSGRVLEKTHSWSAKGIGPPASELQEIPTSVFSWWFASLNRFETIHIPKVSDLPSQANAEQNALQMQGVQSAILVPLVRTNALIGFMELDSLHEEPRWEPEDISLLNVIGGMLCSLLERQAEAQYQRQAIETERYRTMQQRALAETAGMILSVQSLEALWQVMTNAAQKILSADRTAVYTLDTATDTLTCPYAYGLTDEYVSELNKQFRDVPGIQVLSNPRPIVINNVEEDLASNPLQKLMLLEGFQSYVVYPLTVPDKVLGAMVIYRNEPTSFTSEDLDTGQTLAHIVAIAFKNVLLLTETAEALTREQKLNEITGLINSTSDLPDILSNVVRLSAELIGADAGLLNLVLDDQVMISYPYSFPRSIDLIPAAKGKGTAWNIVETGETFLLAQYREHPRAQQAWLNTGFGAYIGVPVVAGDTCLGALELFSLAAGKRFSQRELALTESVGRQAGLAIQKTLLYAEMQQRADLLAASLTKQQEVDQQKNVFIENVSHELRTPLGIIYGYAELLETGGLGQLARPQLEAIRIIVRRSRMLNSLIEDLSALLASRTQEFQREAIDPNQLMVSMLADLRIMTEEAGINLKSDLKEVKAWIKGDPTHLRRVFDNLASNALKATAAGDSIIVRMWEEETDVLIEVEDTGIGIPEEKLKRVFERFFQADSHPTRRYKGTGLGLSLVKEIVDAHRGKITVQSTVDQGTTFQLRFPAFIPTSESG